MFFKFAVLCVAVSAVSGAPSAPAAYGAPPLSAYGTPEPAPPAYGVPEPAPPAYGAPASEPIPPYAFNYAALDSESQTDFSAEEESKDGSVIGQYKVLRADGIIMTVTYSVEGDSGFVADIATEKAPESGVGSGYGAPVEPAYGAPPAPAYGG